MDTGVIQEHNSINRIQRYRGYSSIMGYIYRIHGQRYRGYRSIIGYIYIGYRDNDTGGTVA